jgi:hypothetical protein
MSNTGVGGIKDSQGNYDIVGKSNSTLGTRGGPLLVPVGDVVGQTSGAISANVYTATTLGNASAVAVSVQAFTPASPPTPASAVSSLSMGVDVGGDGVLALVNANEDGIRVGVDAVVGSYTKVGGETTPTWIDAVNAYPSKMPSLPVGQSTLDAFFAFHFTAGDALTRSITLPFDGQVCDAVAQISSPGDVDIVVNAATVETLVAGTTVRRATGFSPIVPTFTKGQTLQVTLAAAPVGTALVRVHYIRTGSVL